MDVYIPLAIYVIAITFIFREHKKIMFFMAFIPLLLFWGTRLDFGADYTSYRDKYNYQHEWDFGTYIFFALGGKIEPGYFLLMKLAPDYNSLIFLCSSIYALGIILFFYKYVPNKFYTLAFIMFLFCSSSYLVVQTIRSSLTLSFFLMACIAKMNNKMKLAYVLALLSATFHMSGFLLLLLLIPKNETLIKYNNVLSVATCLFAFIALLIPNFWASFLNRLMGGFGNLSDSYDQYVYERSVGLGFYFLSFIRIGFIIYVLSLIKRKVISSNYYWFAWMTILYYVFYLIQNVEITYRFCTYLYFITIIFKCYVLMVDKKWTSKMFVGVSIVYTLLNFYNITMNPFNDPTNQEYHSFLI